MLKYIRLYKISQSIQRKKKSNIFIYNHYAANMRWYRNNQTTVTLQRFCHNVSNMIANVFKNCKHLNAALVIMLNNRFLKKLEPWQDLVNIDTFFHLLDICKTLKYNSRVFTQPFQVKVSGSFLSVSASPLIRQGERVPQQLEQWDIPFMVHHHPTQG